MITRNAVRSFVAVVLAGAVIGIVGGHRLYAPQKERPFAVGAQLPLGAVVHIDGTAIQLRETLTQPLTVVTLFSTSCRACYGEAGIWSQEAQHHKNVRIIALAVTEDKSKVSEFAQKTGAKITFGQIDEYTRRQLQAVAVPTIYIIRQNGTVEFSMAGPDATEGLKRRLSELQ